MVTNVHPQVGLQVKLPFGGSGTVAVTELADAYRPNPLDGYSKDQLIRSVGGAATFGCQDFLHVLHTAGLIPCGVRFQLQTVLIAEMQI